MDDLLLVRIGAANPSHGLKKVSSYCSLGAIRHHSLPILQNGDGSQRKTLFGRVQRLLVPSFKQRSPSLSLGDSSDLVEANESSTPSTPITEASERQRSWASVLRLFSADELSRALERYFQGLCESEKPSWLYDLFGEEEPTRGLLMDRVLSWLSPTDNCFLNALTRKVINIPMEEQNNLLLASPFSSLVGLTHKRSASGAAWRVLAYRIRHDPLPLLTLSESEAIRLLQYCNLIGDVNFVSSLACMTCETESEQSFAEELLRKVVENTGHDESMRRWSQ